MKNNNKGNEVNRHSVIIVKTGRVLDMMFSPVGGNPEYCGIVHFRRWQSAVDYACGFVKSNKYTVTIRRNGKKVSYYSNFSD
jgi:hypothetical protein